MCVKASAFVSNFFVLEKIREGQAKSRGVLQIISHISRLTSPAVHKSDTVATDVMYSTRAPFSSSSSSGSSRRRSS
jgi:hypothetical protein